MALFLQIKAKRAAIDNFDVLDIEQEIKTTICFEASYFQKNDLKKSLLLGARKLLSCALLLAKKLQYLMDHLITFNLI